MKRMWVNQPSKSQPLHNVHGALVLAHEGRIRFINHTSAGDINSQESVPGTLSPGWPTHLRKGDTL